MTEGGCVDTVASVREVVVLGQLLPRIIGGDLPPRCDNHAVVGNMTNDGSNWLAWIASAIPCKLSNTSLADQGLMGNNTGTVVS